MRCVVFGQGLGRVSLRSLSPKEPPGFASERRGFRGEMEVRTLAHERFS